MSVQNYKPERLSIFLSPSEMAILKTMAIGDQKSIQDWLRYQIHDAAVAAGLME